MYQVVERSMISGAINRVFSGYATEEEAEDMLECLVEQGVDGNPDDDYWYCVERQ